MNKFAFWNEWNAPFKLTFILLTSLLLFFSAAFLAIQWGGLSPFYYWKLTGYIENLSFPVFSNHSEFIESTITTDLPLIFQKVFGGSKALPNYLSYTYLILLYTCLIGCLTISTYLEKFWYYIGVGLWILLVVLSGIGNVGFFDIYNQTAIIIVLLLFVPLSYYFNTINENIGMGWRFLAFSGLMALVLLVIHFGSTYETPLLFLTRFSYLPASLICVTFILTIGHEIIYAILSLTTPYVKSSSNNTKHFIILSTVYLLNIVILYLYRVNYLDWDIYYLNEFALIALSSILGIWGIKSRENLYSRFLPHYPYTAFLYLILGLITFITFAYQSYHGNDAFIASMQSMILYSHIGFGLMFFLYIIFNFITQLQQNLPVHQFAYIEDNFPYISARIAGLIIVAALFFRSHFGSFYLGMAGYYNGLGDLNLTLENESTAKYYYKESVSKNAYNHHGNYQLAQLEDEPILRLKYLKNAIKSAPTSYAFASLGREYENNSRFFDALFTYQDGLKEFPNNWAIQNNIALLYNKTNVIDSAIYYLENSTPGTWKQAVVDANRKAVASLHGWPIKLDESKNLERFDLQSNSLANQLINKDTSSLTFITQPPSISLNLFTYSYLKNLGLYCNQNQLPEFLQLVDPFLDAPDNAAFRKELNIVKALNLYQNGQVAKAIEIIFQLKEVYEDESGKWNALLGKWCLELDAPLLASKYLEAARETLYPNVSADLSLAYHRLGDQSLALFLLSKESTSNDSINPTMAAEWTKLFDAMQQNKVSWNSYSFTREKEMLTQAKIATADQRLLFERIGLENPFFEEGVLAASDYFKETDKDEEMSYQVLREAITINEYSEVLIKAYIEHCLATGLIDFADDALIKLIDILPEEDYQAYEIAFEVKKEQAQAQLDQDW
ncbi:tetratricopeptide repeat protein [Reichenbachiella sp.]|uniref:tetratricopeptide repeat protein n=1 Tax=Reichenbachiella sp. TaxID=2184521 RepID=UPI003BB126A9